MSKPPTVWGIRGVRPLPNGHVRLPDGSTRLLDEMNLLTSNRPPAYAAKGRLRVIQNGPQRILAPNPIRRRGQSAFQNPDETPAPPPTPSPSITPSPTPTPTITPTFTPTPSPTPTPTPTPSPTPTPPPSPPP